jgi:hypothetical protein
VIWGVVQTADPFALQAKQEHWLLAAVELKQLCGRDKLAELLVPSITHLIQQSTLSPLQICRNSDLTAITLISRLPEGALLAG